MKRIKDERLQLQNLKNIRIVFLIQNIGIIGILGYDFVNKGLDGMKDNPLWFIFLVSMIVSTYLSMSVSTDYEKQPTKPKKSLGISILIAIVICTLVGFSISNSDGNSLFQGVIMGGILFVCALIPIIYIYVLRIKQHTAHLDE